MSKITYVGTAQGVSPKEFGERVKRLLETKEPVGRKPEPSAARPKRPK